MKINNVYKIALLLVLFVGLQSRKNGPGLINNPGLQVTGAPGSTGTQGTCANAGCHVAGAFNPMLTMQFFENGNLAASWESGKQYTLRLTISATQGMPARYGFQAVALDGSNIQAGDWGDLGTDKHSVSLSGRQYAEHSLPLTASVIELPWKAPDSGTETVTFYAAALASDNSGTTSGDGVAKNKLIIPSANVSSVSDLVQEYARLEIQPNPVGDWLNLAITNRSPGDYQLRFFTTTGKLARVEPIQLVPGMNHASFSVGDLSTGLYVLQLYGKSGHVAAAQLLKR
ncbi:MAG: choice-of-anchor V domain-containing protein [Saprospiraceae bacterium]